MGLLTIANGIKTITNGILTITNGILTITNGIFTRGQFWAPGIVVACDCLCLCVRLSVRQSLDYPRNNSGPVLARVTKCGPKMQNTLTKVPVVLWSDRPGPSMSNITWKSKFTQFWACPHHHPFKLGSPNFDQMMQKPWLRSLSFCRAIDRDLQGQIWLKSQIFGFHHYWKYITTT